jgi:hypothetical protein
MASAIPRLLVGLGGLALLAAALPVTAGSEAPSTLPLSIAITRPAGGEPVTTPCWVLAQVRESQRLMAPHRVRVGIAEMRAIEGHHALETAQDRDALADLLQPKVINVFVVESLRDVDDPKLFRMGVRWRKLSDLSKDYVIVTARAMPTTLAHELGHKLGNGHSPVVDNVMSYKRQDPAKIHFDERQGAKMRQVSRQLLLSKRVAALASDETEEKIAEGCR